MSDLKASVIIPVKNEPYLPTLLKQLKNYEVLVQTEPGLANAVLHGVKRAHNEKIAVIDGDGSHPTKYLSAMFQTLNYCDVVVGSRYVNGGGTEDSFMREVLSRIFNSFAQFLLQIKVKDNMSGFIVAKRKVFENLNLKPFGYKFGLEIIVKSKGKYQVREYPIVFEKRKLGSSKTSFGQGIKTFAFIIKLWLEQL